MSVIETKYIHAGNRVIELCKDKDGLWRSPSGTVFALAENYTPSEAQCGAGIFTLPKDSKYTPFCGVHDFMYSSPAYQAFHTRSEADEALRIMLSEARHTFIGRVFKFLSRIFGEDLWENKTTRNL
jgi:hypothetical protein